MTGGAGVLDTARVQHVLDMHDHEARAKLFEVMKEDVFRLRYAETRETERARTTARWMRLAELGLWDHTVSDGGSRRAKMRYDANVECMALLDHSLEVKTGVHYGLFGATITKLGTPEQAARYAPLIESLQMVGCFGLTELGHGSNVRGIETTAAYDADSGVFVLNTPSESAQKYWIGAAAETARWCAVFAQLHVGGKARGVHALLVQIRRDDTTSIVPEAAAINARIGGEPMPGITIADCGDKVGLQGVDNGRLWFDNVAVPRENLLSRFATVDESGTYSTSLRSVDELFARQLGALTGGRVSIAVGAINQSKLGLTIAVRYALSRRAFGPPSASEVPLMFYQSHQLRLMPALAATYVMALGGNRLKQLYWDCSNGVSKQVHVLSSGFKALFTWHMRDCLQQCREACGGQGYKSENRIAPVKNDHDVMMTFEGDNSVLLQQVARSLLAEHAAAAFSRAESAKSRRSADAASKYSSGLVELGVPVSSKAIEKLVRAVHSVNVNRDSCDTKLASFLSHAFQARTAILLDRLARRLRAAMATQQSGFESWNDCLELASQASRAYVDLLLFEWFQSEMAGHNPDTDVCSSLDSSSRSIVRRCGTLYGLEIATSNPLFLQLRVFSPEQAEQLSTLRIAGASSLSAHAEALVAAFGVPEHLSGPIAGDWLTHNSRAKL